MTRSLSRIVTVSAVFIAVGILLGYIESLFVIPVRIPGIRIGLANIVTVITLYLCGPYVTLVVLFARICLSALLFGSPISFSYSLAGAAAALSGMLLFKKLGFSVYGVSVIGAVLHNIAQIAVAGILVGNGYVLYYIFALIPAGVVSGLVVGIMSNILISRLKRFMMREENP